MFYFPLPLVVFHNAFFDCPISFACLPFFVYLSLSLPLSQSVRLFLSSRPSCVSHRSLVQFSSCFHAVICLCFVFAPGIFLDSLSLPFCRQPFMPAIRLSYCFVFFLDASFVKSLLCVSNLPPSLCLPLGPHILQTGRVNLILQL